MVPHSPAQLGPASGKKCDPLGPGRAESACKQVCNSDQSQTDRQKCPRAPSKGGSLAGPLVPLARSLAGSFDETLAMNLAILLATMRISRPVGRAHFQFAASARPVRWGRAPRECLASSGLSRSLARFLPSFLPLSLAVSRPPSVYPWPKRPSQRERERERAQINIGRTVARARLVIWPKSWREFANGSHEPNFRPPTFFAPSLARSLAASKRLGDDTKAGNQASKLESKQTNKRASRKVHRICLPSRSLFLIILAASSFSAPRGGGELAELLTPSRNESNFFLSKSRSRS